MWYTLPDSNKQYPLTIERVIKIKELNQQGIRPDDLEPVEVVSSKTVEKEPEFVELVGQISLKSLDKAADKKRQQNRNQNQERGQRPQQRQQGGGQQQGGNQQQGGGNNQNRPNRNRPRPNNPNRNRGGQQGGNQQGPDKPQQS